MILICDNDASPRAKNLQGLFLDLGYPAAVCPINEIKEHLPAWFFVTFCDSFDNLRRTPYDKIFTIAIDNGFVNTALNATKVTTVNEALSCSLEIVKSKLGISNGGQFPFGILCRSVFFADYFIEVRNNIIPLTNIEMLIFKYIFICSGENIYADKSMIEKYCYSPASRGHSGNVISVHIANINKKSEEILGSKIIGSMRYKGYYIINT
ncbi:MAG: hypothetical protein E7628_02990 [Ruminococcaceae bacterium]|nr:hypothetical protein [Oscillospiraceae bacterium]